MAVCNSYCNMIFRNPAPTSNILICLPAICFPRLRLETSGIIALVFPSSQWYQAAPPAWQRAQFSPARAFWGGRQNERPLQHHMGVKYGCCIKREQGVRQYVMHPYNKLSVCLLDEMRERVKGTVMAFWDDRDIQGSVRRDTEHHWSNLSLLRQSSSIPCLLWLLHFRKMFFKQFDRSRRELLRQTLEFDFVPFIITLAQKIAHCFLERIFGGWFFLLEENLDATSRNALTKLLCTKGVLCWNSSNIVQLMMLISLYSYWAFFLLLFFCILRWLNFFYFLYFIYLLIWWCNGFNMY